MEPAVPELECAIYVRECTLHGISELLVFVVAAAAREQAEVESLKLKKPSTASNMGGDRTSGIS